MSLPLSLDARELKERVDLSEFAGQFTRLRRSGKQLIGLCPIHSERHPSFYVHPGRQVWFCFGCNRGGDLFDFVMLAECCDFRRALQIASEFSGRVARVSEPRCGSRLGAGEGAKPLSPPKAGALHSQFNEDSRSRILRALEATERRLRAIDATNREAAASLATACEPDRYDDCFLTSTQRITPDGEPV